MPFTTLKKLSVQTAASNPGTWGAGGTTGNDLNTGVMGPIDTILAGISSFSVGSSNVTLQFTAGGGADVSNCMFRFTGTLTANIIASPAAGDATTYFNGFYYWENLTTGNFTVTVQNAVNSLVLPQSMRGVFFVDGVNGLRLVSAVGKTNGPVFPVGTVSSFFQAAAPTGWTQVTTPALNSTAIQLVTDGTGGTTGGSVAFSTLFGRTATDSYTLTAANMPTAATYNKVTLSNAAAAGAPNLGTIATLTSGALDGAANTSFTMPINMQVQYAKYLVASYTG